MSLHRNEHAGQFQNVGATHEAAVRAGTAEDVSRADVPQFRDVSRAMHVRPQVTLDAREVARDARAYLSRFSSIIGAQVVGLVDDSIESKLEPTRLSLYGTQGPRP